MVAIVLVSTAVRAAASLKRETLLLYPDEYIYTQISRGIAATGLPEVRGAFTNFHPVVVPYLMSPVWLIHDATLAYHVALGVASLWFSLAAIPAYALARRAGVTQAGSLAVAVLALLVPDGAYTTTLLTEPYAYPIFLATVLLAVDTISRPSRLRQVALVGAFAALVFVRLQFVVLPFAYLLVLAVYFRGSLRSMARTNAVVVAAIGGSVVIVSALGLRRIEGYYAGGFHLAEPSALARWFGAEAFIAFIAAGWVLAPAAVVGFWRLARAGSETERAFASVSAIAVVALIGETAWIDATLEGHSLERYAFYIVPLIVVAAVRALESVWCGLACRVISYVAAAVAIGLPATGTGHAALNAQAPTMVGLYALVGGHQRAALIWALALASLVLLVGAGVIGRRSTLAIAAAVQVLIAAGATVDLLRPGSLGAAHFQNDRQVVVNSPGAPGDVPHGTAYISAPVTNMYVMMQTLFWNPGITRVLVVGGAAPSDGFSATPVTLSASGDFLDRAGRLVPGPYFVDQQSTAIAAPGATPASVFHEPPALLFFGLDSRDGYLSTTGMLHVRGSGRPETIRLRLLSVSGPKALGFICGSDRWNVPVERGGASVSLVVPSHRVLACRISLIRGAAARYAGRLVSVKVTRLSYIVARSKR